MRKLVKLGIVALFLVSNTISFAQVIGLKGGLNLADMLSKDDTRILSDDYKMNPGFHLGPTVEFPISEKFSVESGLLLSVKGMKSKVERTFYGEIDTYKTNVSLYYLDIPVAAKVYFDIGNSKIYGTFGPYMGIGISGKAKTENTENGKTEKKEYDIHFGSDEREDELKTLDVGITAGAGLTLKAIEIGVTYNLGLANVSFLEDEGYKLTHRVLGISVGYKFGNNASPATSPQ